MQLSRREPEKTLPEEGYIGRVNHTMQTPGSANIPQWGMVIDLRKCIGCQACSVACAMENQLPQNHFRTFVSIYEVEWNGQPRRAVLPRTCNHCDNPPCVRNCPTQATYKDKTGIVLVNNTVCIGCGYCIQTCPYDARYINPDSHTTDKCTFCLHRLNAGLLPACVETCVGGARVFGDLTDPNSQVSQLLKENAVRVMKPDLNTLPRVYYIAMDEYGKVGLDRSGSPKSEISASAKGKVLNG